MLTRVLLSFPQGETQQTMPASPGLRRAGSAVHIVGEPLKAFYDQYKDEHEGEEPPPHVLREAATRLYRERVRGGTADWKACRKFIKRWKDCYVHDIPEDREREVSCLDVASVRVKPDSQNLVPLPGVCRGGHRCSQSRWDGARGRYPSRSLPTPAAVLTLVFNVQVSPVDLCSGLQIVGSRKRPRSPSRPSSASDFVAVRACAAGQVEEIQGGEDGDGADEQNSQHGQPASTSAGPTKLQLRLHSNPPTFPHGGRHRPVRILLMAPPLNSLMYCLLSCIVGKTSAYAPFLSVFDSNERGRVSSFR